MTLLTYILLKDQDQFTSVWMTVDNSLLKDQLEIHLGCKLTQNKDSENMNFSRLKIVSLFYLYSDASKIYFQKDLFKFRGTHVINIIIRSQSST